MFLPLTFDISPCLERTTGLVIFTTLYSEQGGCYLYRFLLHTKQGGCPLYSCQLSVKPSSMGVDCTRRRLRHTLIDMSCLGMFHSALLESGSGHALCAPSHHNHNFLSILYNTTLFTSCNLHLYVLSWGPLPYLGSRCFRTLFCIWLPHPRWTNTFHPVGVSLAFGSMWSRCHVLRTRYLYNIFLFTQSPYPFQIMFLTYVLGNVCLGACHTHLALLIDVRFTQHITDENDSGMILQIPPRYTILVVSAASQAHRR